MKQRRSSNIFIFFYLMFFLTSSCKQVSNDSLIEIYTLKEKVYTDEGMPYSELLIKDSINITDLTKEKNTLRYDTVKKEFIYAGRFDVKNDNLKEEPLINDNEIVMIDTLSSKIKISASAFNKIISLEPSMKEGLQFAFCKDRKVLFTGYFWSSLSSYGSTWNCIEYNHTKDINQSITLTIYKGNGINAQKREKINFNDYSELVKIFNEKGKIGNLSE